MALGSSQPVWEAISHPRASPDFLRSFKHAGGRPNVRHVIEAGMVPGSVTLEINGVGSTNGQNARRLRRMDYV